MHTYGKDASPGHVVYVITACIPYALSRNDTLVLVELDIDIASSADILTCSINRQN